jgi:hypothetical protein
MSEFVRSDLREAEKGICTLHYQMLIFKPLTTVVALELDIGVIDIKTCQPLSGVFMEL